MQPWNCDFLKVLEYLRYHGADSFTPVSVVCIGYEKDSIKWTRSTDGHWRIYERT